MSPSGNTGRPRIDVDELVGLVASLPTDVVVLDSMAASEKLSDSISEAFHCYGGSVRVVMPRARVTDHFRRHPLLLIYPDDDPALSLRRIVDRVERTPSPSAAAPAAPPPLRVPTGPVPTPTALFSRAAATPPVPDRSSQPDTAPDLAVQAPVADHAAPDQAAVPDHTPFGLADIEAVVARAVARTLEEQLGGPGSEAERERSRADTAEELWLEAEERIRRLESEATDRIDLQQLPQVYANEEAQLRWEVETIWLTTTPETERVSCPLLPWTVSPAVFEGLAHPVVPRRKTIEVMLAVLTSRVWDACTSHQFRESEGGKARTSPTGTSIWRTYVRANTPQAPRLTWWQNPDQSIHFDHVGVHDALL